LRIKHIVLDRDGVLNHEAPEGAFIGSPSDFKWLDGALDALKALRQAGVRLSVATNQSAIGRGILTSEQVEAVNRTMREQARLHGADIDAVFFCPHGPNDGCPCRKPRSGLIDAAIDQARIGADQTLLVGDDLRDLEAGRRAGVSLALVRTGKGESNEHAACELGARVYDDMPALARAVLGDDIELVGAHRTQLKIRAVFADHLAVTTQAGTDLLGTIASIVTSIERCLRDGNKVMACGNGGSAADAQHLVAELVGRFRDERRALAAITLMADAATLTALSNDYGYDRVFARQVEALGRPGDVLIAISTSGNSPNVLQAATAARAAECHVVAFTGAAGGKLAEQADLVLRAPSKVVARIQEVHGLCIHAIADALDERLIPADAP
jgi:D-sedoheptulose 7-phosphate isomerase